jgi:hypothetical protein
MTVNSFSTDGDSPRARCRNCPKKDCRNILTWPFIGKLLRSTFWWYHYNSIQPFSGENAFSDFFFCIAQEHKCFYDIYPNALRKTGQSIMLIRQLRCRSWAVSPCILSPKEDRSRIKFGSLCCVAWSFGYRHKIDWEICTKAWGLLFILFPYAMDKSISMLVMGSGWFENKTSRDCWLEASQYLLSLSLGLVQL